MKLKSKLFIQLEIVDNMIMNGIESISISQLNRILLEYFSFIDLINNYTNNLIDFSPNIEFISDHNLTYNIQGKRGNKKDIFLEIDNIVAMTQFIKVNNLDDYDTVIIVTPWSNTGLDTFYHMTSRGGFYVNKSIIWSPSMIDGFEDKGIGALFIHEWLHGLTRYLFPIGLNENIHPDNSQYFGFNNPTYLNYYRAILNDELYYKGVHFSGINNLLIKEYVNRNILSNSHK